MKLAFSIVGTQKEMAEGLGVTYQRVQQFLREPPHPPTHVQAMILEELTAGKVRCEWIRPDAPWHVIRKSATSLGVLTQPEVAA